MNERLRRMDDERIARLEERVSNWMEQTTEYRKDLCKKLDTITTKIDNLPCPARQEITKSIHKDIGWLQKIVWTVCITGIPSIILLAVTWGGIKKDVEHLKEASYAYKEIKAVTDGKLNRV